jgi:hypothetical protein
MTKKILIEEILIEKNVPVPKSSYGTLANTLRKMKVGNSFFYEVPTSARSALSRIERETGFTFITRKEKNGVRVWRVT